MEQKREILYHSCNPVISNNTWGNVSYRIFAILLCYLGLRKKYTVGTKIPHFIVNTDTDRPISDLFGWAGYSIDPLTNTTNHMN